MNALKGFRMEITKGFTNMNFKEIIDKRKWLILVFMSIIGLALSYLTVNATFIINADVSNSPVVWDEINKHGIGILHDWLATPDNWYFSNYPIHFLAFSIFGSSPGVIIGISVLQQYFIALIASIIIKRETKSNLAYIAIPVLCLFSWVAHNLGYISHPFSHNLINGYGLLCVYLYSINRNLRSISIDLLILILSVAAAVSDPWFVAAFYIPMMICSITDTFVYKVRSKLSLLIPALTGVIIFSHVIENYLKLPIGHFELGKLSEIPSKLYWVLYGLGENASLIPYESISVFIISGIAWSSYYIYSLIKSRSADYLTIIFFFSSCGILGAFLLGNVPASPSSARFFTNLTYISIITAITTLIRHKDRVSFVIIFMLIISSAFSYISNKPHTAEVQDFVDSHGLSPKTSEIIQFLDKNNLHYGFGPYWGMQAISIGWVTHGDFTVRPAYFDKSTGEMKYPGRAQTFNHWYEAESQPDVVPQFIAVMNDKEECPDVNLCISGVTEQFGKPDRTEKFAGATFLIYNKKLLGYNRIDISGEGNVDLGVKSDKNVWKGFRSKEDGFRWTSGKNVEIFLSSDKWKQSSFEIVGTSYQPLSGSVYVNGKKTGVFSNQPGDVSIKVKAENEGSGNNIDIRIIFDKVISPKEAGINTDTSNLGIAVKTIRYNISV